MSNFTKKCYLCGDGFQSTVRVAKYCSINCKSVAEGSWYASPSKKRVRLAIFARDGFRCVYCGIKSRACELEVDHIVPIAHEGKTEAQNIVTACRSCNQAKGDLILKPETIHQLWKDAFVTSSEEVTEALKTIKSWTF